jgi:hypothetical protein
MRFAIIENGRVANVVEADEAFGTEQGWIPAPDEAGPGDLYDGQAFSRPPAVVTVPQEVTRRQARQALLLAGILPNVQPAIDAIADATQRGLIQIEWDDSQTFQRHRPALLQLAAALGLSSAQLDELFIQASKL